MQFQCRLSNVKAGYQMSIQAIQCKCWLSNRNSGYVMYTMSQPWKCLFVIFFFKNMNKNLKCPYQEIPLLIRNVHMIQDQSRVQLKYTARTFYNKNLLQLARSFFSLKIGIGMIRQKIRNVRPIQILIAFCKSFNFCN